MWEYEIQIDNMYQSGSQLSGYIVKSWDNVLNSWINGSMTNYTYDNNPFLISLEKQAWDTTSSTWEKNEFIDITNSAIGQPVETVFQTWDNVNGVYTNDYRSTLTYFNCTTTGLQAEILKNDIFIYPNPVSDFLGVTGISLSGSNVWITDVTGKVIRTAILEDDSSLISVKDLKPGMYLLQVADKRISRRFVVAD